MKFVCFSGQTAVTFLNNKKTLIFVMLTKFILYEVEPKLIYKLHEVKVFYPLAGFLATLGV